MEPTDASLKRTEEVLVGALLLRAPGLIEMLHHSLKGIL
jgi:hypothetical protein